jgi:hypothetical protein
VRVGLEAGVVGTAVAPTGVDADDVAVALGWTAVAVAIGVAVSVACLAVLAEAADS